MTKRKEWNGFPCKRVWCIVLLFALSPLLHGQEMRKSEDSSFIFRFPHKVSTFVLDYRGNRSEAMRLGALLKNISCDTAFLHVRGYSKGIREDARRKKRMRLRSNYVKGYLITFNGLRETNFRTENMIVSYDELEEVVVVTFLSRKSECDTCRPLTVLPEVESKENFEIRKDPVCVVERWEEHPVFDHLMKTDAPIREGGLVILKTNVMGWALVMMNMAVEVQVGEKMTVELPVTWSPWSVGQQHGARTFLLQPEARWWLQQVGSGHFFGINAHVGWFNVKWNKNRYQDTSRPLLGGGLSYGYALPLGGKWGAEFLLGGGYVNMKYDRFYNIDNGARVETQTKNYWGITRVGLSVTYRIKDKN